MDYGVRRQRCARAGYNCRQKRRCSRNLREQVEYYLSDQNLRYDKVFNEKMTADAGGWLDVACLLACPRVQAMKATQTGILRALKDSELETKEEGVGTFVRRKGGARPPSLESRCIPGGPFPPSAHDAHWMQLQERDRLRDEKLSDVRHLVQQLHADLATVRREKSDLELDRDRKAALESEEKVKQLEESCEDLLEQLMHQKRCHVEARHALGEAEADLMAANRQRSGLEAAKAEIEQTLSKVRNVDTKALEEKLQRQAAAKGTLSAEVDRHWQRCDEVTKHAEETRKRNADLEDELTELKRNHAREAQARSLRIRGPEDRLREREVDQTEVQQVKEEAERKMEDATSRIAQSERGKDGVIEERRRRDGQMQELEKEGIELRAENSRLQAELARRSAAVADHQRQKESLEVENANLKLNAADVERQLDSTKDEGQRALRICVHQRIGVRERLHAREEEFAEQRETN